MKKRRRILIIILFFILLGIAWFFFWLSQDQRKEVINDTKNLFPFGEIQSTGTGTDTEETQDSNEGVQNTEDEDTGGPVKKPQPKLRKISNFPTGGFIPLTRIDSQLVRENTTDIEGNSFQTERIIEVENNYVRYGEIKNGSIYDTKVTPYFLEQEKIVENLIPNTEKILFSKNGEYATLQYWNKSISKIETYFGNIRKITLNIKNCPFDFTQKIELGSEGEHVADVHKFLNRNPRTMIAKSGINSPGNEGSKALESTIIAIKNFQSLNELDIDGFTGPSTRAKMKEICNKQQKQIAQKEFDERDKKYEFLGQFFGRDIISIAMSPEGATMFYLQEQTHQTIGSLYEFISEEKRNIFSSPLKEIYTYWNSPDAIQISTKPSYKAETFTYSMDTQGDYHKSVPQEKGMTTLASPNNLLALISKIDSNGINTSLKRYSSRGEIMLNITTLSDKCVWSNDNINIYCAVPKSFNYNNQYPDSWYQGLELYTDDLYQINAETLETKLISDISLEYNESIDVSSINIDEKNEYLYFIDKGTEHLWSYRLFDI